MGLYLGLIAALYLFSLTKGYNRQAVFNFMMFLLALVSGLRYQTGTDYGNFVGVFRNFISGKKVYTEIGYNFYMYLVNALFGANTLVLYLGQALLIVWSFARFIRKNVLKEYWLYAGSLFVTSTIFFQTMNTSRQYVSIAFLLIAFDYGKERKMGRFVLFSLIALTFHLSSIICVAVFLFLFLFINKRKDQDRIMRLLNTLVLISIILGVIDVRNIFAGAAGLLSRISFFRRFLTYLSSTFFLARNGNSRLKFIIPNFVWFYIYSHYKRFKQTKKEIPYMDYYFILFAIYLIIENCFSGINVFIRIAIQFEVFLLPVIPICIKSASKANRGLLYIFFLLYFLALTVYSIFLQGGTGTVPYRCILFYPQNIYLSNYIGLY